MQLSATPDASIYCRKCSYDLRGQVEYRCPECGLAYDPADPATFRRTPRGESRKWIKRIAMALAVFLIIAAAPYAWLYYDWRREQPAVERIKALNTNVTVTRLEIPVVSLLLPKRWDWVLERVETIFISWDEWLTDADLALLRDCRRLSRLIFIGSSLTDARLAELRHLPRLTTLYISSPNITGKGLETLADLPRLEELRLTASSMNDDELQSLRRLSRLRRLTLHFADRLTPEGEQRLRQALPQTQISVDRFSDPF